MLMQGLRVVRVMRIPEHDERSVKFRDSDPSNDPTRRSSSSSYGRARRR